MTAPAVSPRTFSWGVAAACLVFAMLAWSGAVSDSITYDEGPFLHYGLAHLDGSSSRKQVWNSKLPVTALHAFPVLVAEHAFGVSAVRIDEGLVQETPGAEPRFRWEPSPVALGLGRSVAVAIGVALVIALALAARSLAGPGAGLSAALLAAIEPNLLAHGHYVTADVPSALATLLFALACLRWARSKRPRDAALAGASFGLALLTKFVLLVLGPIAVLAVLARSLALRFAAAGREETAQEPAAALARRGLGSFAAAAVAALLVLNAGFFGRGSPGSFPETPRSERVAALGAIGRGPLPLPASWLEGLDWTLADEERGRSFGNLYLQGEARKEPFFRYYVVVLARKLPLALILLLGVSLVGAPHPGPPPASRGEGEGLRQDRVFLATFALSFLLFLSFLNRAQIGVRHALPVFPFLIIEAGGALAGLASGGPRKRGLALVLVLWMLGSVLSFAPDLLPYTNELVLPRTNAYRTFADSNLDWGQADAAFVEWLEGEKAAGRTVAVAPQAPVSGCVAVSVNALAGVTRPARDFAWLRELVPAFHVRHAWLVFFVTEDEAARARGAR